MPDSFKASGIDLYVNILRKVLLSRSRANLFGFYYLFLINCPDAVNEHSVDEGVQTVCPGELVSLICIHDNVAGQLTRWIVSGSQPCDEFVAHFTDSTEDMCGLFTITRIGNTVSTLYSTIQIPVTEALHGWYSN